MELTFRIQQFGPGFSLFVNGEQKISGTWGQCAKGARDLIRDANPKLTAGPKLVEEPAEEVS